MSQHRSLYRLLGTAIGIAALATALYYVGTTKRPVPEATVIYGRPVSVSGANALGSSGAFSTLIEVEDGNNKRFILAHVYSDRTVRRAEAVALIRSAITEGNLEIQLKGYHYQEGRFKIKELKTQGYKVSF